MADLVGQQFGNYRLLRLLGRGGFAQVYLGQHLRLSTQQAAIKILDAHLDNGAMRDFEHEAAIISSLLHPHIVRVLDFDINKGTPFLVMDYAPDGSLRQRHRAGEQVPLSAVISYVQQIADGLQYAHDRAFIHRDIKPGNMLIGRQGEILLSDFGIATIAHSTNSQSNQGVTGTMHYMAPEQIQARPQRASDQYALAITVYEWLAGELPFTGGSFIEIMTQHLMAPPPSLCAKRPALSQKIEQVVLTALAKDPNARFESVQAFAIALRKAITSDSSIVALPPYISINKSNALSITPSPLPTSPGENREDIAEGRQESFLAPA